MLREYTRDVPSLAIDPQKSRVRIRTFAEGFLSRLAHDLEIVCEKIEGTATREGATATATLRVPLSAMTVSGVLKKGALDTSVLSESDRRDVVDKMRREVFHADASAAVEIEATLDGASARVRVTPPKHRGVEVVLTPRISDVDGAVRVEGTFEISLASIGSDPVKGPMGAFKVKDRIEILADLTFR